MMKRETMKLFIFGIENRVAFIFIFSIWPFREQMRQPMVLFELLHLNGVYPVSEKTNISIDPTIYMSMFFW